VTGPLTVLPELGAVKQRVTVYLPDEGVLEAQGFASGCTRLGVLAAGSGLLAAGSGVLASGSGILAAGSSVLAAGSFGVDCCAYAGVAGIENTSNKIAMNKDMRFIRIIFLPWTLLICYETMPVPGLLVYSRINYLVDQPTQSFPT
jgi:hypothetical protein